MIRQYRLLTQDKVYTLFDAQDLSSMLPGENNEDYIYGYQPENERPTPPIIADERLWHFLCHPRASINDGTIDYECRNWLLKRLRPLSIISDKECPVGWSVDFVERFSWEIFCYCESFIGSIAMVFLCLWAAVNASVEGVSVAFTIGHWSFRAGQLL